MDKKQIAIALVVGILGYLLLGMSAAGTSNEWMDFARKNVCLPNNMSFDLYTNTGILHYDAVTSKVTARKELVNYNTTATEGGLVLFCTNTTSYTECSTICKKEIEKEYCYIGNESKYTGGFVVVPST